MIDGSVGRKVVGCGGKAADVGGCWVCEGCGGAAEVDGVAASFLTAVLIGDSVKIWMPDIVADDA